MRCRMNFAAYPTQTQTPQFVDLGGSANNALYEGSGLSNPATRIRTPTDGAHWSATYHIFVETTAVGVSEAKSDYGYNFKLSFKFGKK